MLFRRLTLRNDTAWRWARAGTGRTGYLPVPPNNYPFYTEDEKYVPIVQADGGQLSGGLVPWSSLVHDRGRSLARK
jgi:hypothetical protein